ncbi:MAG: hypothetical protein Q8K36_02265 [Alphaproteobacteria bacterium]|nr:hypothetical protein [Alphaproteobacteria bacterium]
MTFLKFRALRSAAIFGAISLSVINFAASENECNKQSEISSKAHVETARFVGKPKKDHPILLVFFHGLGHHFDKAKQWVKQFEKKDGSVKAIVFHYDEAQLTDFVDKINTTLSEIHSAEEHGKKSEIVAQKEMELLPILRGLFLKNMDLVRKQFNGIPLENIVIVGNSLGGLLASTLVEVLGNNDLGQVQAVLTSMAPPVGFVNCRVHDENQTLLPWIIHTEMGTKDHIFVNGADQMMRCCQVFKGLNAEEQKRITCSTHDGDHVSSKEFLAKIRETLSTLVERQKADA